MLNRYLNTLDNDEKTESIMILEEALQKYIDEGVKEWINHFLRSKKMSKYCKQTGLTLIAFSS